MKPMTRDIGNREAARVARAAKRRGAWGARG
jgi:hypothetical protein